MRVLLAIALCLAGMRLVAKDEANDPCGSILDVDHLSVEEKGKLRAEIQQFQALRKVNGEAVCVQIDFLEQLPPVQEGFTEDGRKIIRQNVYDQWQTEHFGQPAVLFLFVKDPEQSKFVLNDMVVSRPVAQRVLNLVRLYIRDEIVKKQTTYYDAINAGIYAFGQALNGEYKERLVEQSISLLDENYYYRGYTYYPLNYFYFTANHLNQNNLSCDQISYFIDDKPHQLFLAEDTGDKVQNETKLSEIRATHFDLYADQQIGYFSSAHGNISNVDGKGKVVLKVTKEDADRIFTKVVSNSVKLTDLLNYEHDYIDFYGSSDFSDIQDLENKGDGKYAGLSDKINEINENKLHFKEWEFVKFESPLVFDDHNKHCLCTVRVTTGVKNKGEAYSTLEGLSTYGKTRFRGSQCTMCNHYASDLSAILGGRRGVPAGKSSSSLATAFKNTSNYINLKNIQDAGKELFWKYIDLGYPVYFCKSGHIETGYPSGYDNIGHKEKYGDEFEKSDLSTYDTKTTFHTIGAGAETGMKHYDGFSFLNNTATGAFLYLGYLKK